MSALQPNPLLDALPDLVLLIRRDGVLLAHAGGSAVAALIPENGSVGQRLGGEWTPALSSLVKQLVRRAIAERKSVEARFADAADHYELRVSAQAPDRALCIIRAAIAPAGEDPLSSTGEHQRPELDRRGFLRRLQQTLALAAMQEKPAAVAVIHVDGLSEIARVVDTKISEQVLSAALLRLPRPPTATATDAAWYLGQLSDTVLGLVIETADRNQIEQCLDVICSTLRDPVNLGDA